MDVVTRGKEATTTRKTRERTCVGCGRADGPNALLRLVLGPSGEDRQQAREVAPDVAGGAIGRGAHVHPSKDCLEKACRGGLSRAFKTRVAADAKVLAAQIAAGCEQRIVGLLSGARRAGALSVGADAAVEALVDGAPLVVLARDAGTVMEKDVIQRAIAEGRAIAWLDKAGLGGVLGRGEVAMCAVKDESIANELSHARRVADALKPAREK